MTLPFRFLLSACLAGLTLLAADLPQAAQMPPAFAAGASAEQILAACRRMLPVRPVELRGTLVRRSRRGIPQCEYDYTLAVDRVKSPAELTLELRTHGATNVLQRTVVSRPGPLPQGVILDTDVTWLDLSLDFLWWSDAAFEAEREGESVHGQKCSVILVTPSAPVAGVAAVRLWVDRRTGCLMQAEQLDAARKPLRRLWGTRVKKFGERWMVKVLEVEAPGTGHRTKVTVEELNLDGARESL